MTTPIQAQPSLPFIEPSFNPFVLGGVRAIMPLWIRYQTAIAKIETKNLDQLVNLYYDFQEGKNRLMIAFRHPSINDLYAISYLLWYLIPQAAKRQGLYLNFPVHSHFIYDRGIPLWAGSQVGWLFSQLGGTPIFRGKADWKGLKSARNLFANGLFPMTAAPEGGTNGHNEIVSPLEPGIAQLGFWCAEDLVKSERTEEVLIVPVGIRYHYLESPWKAIAQLLAQLENLTGLPIEPEDLSQPALYRRLYRIGDRLLTLMEEFYRRFYHESLIIPEASETSANDVLAMRMQNLLNTALGTAEAYFKVAAKGSLIDRCRRLEQAGWDYIYREDWKELEDFSPVERGLANRVAEEANLRLWHMRLVENFVAVTGRYVLENPTAERFAETALQLWKTAVQIQGGDRNKLPCLGKQQAILTIGEPISVTERYPSYQANRTGARQAVATLTQDLQAALERLI